MTITHNKRLIVFLLAVAFLMCSNLVSFASTGAISPNIEDTNNLSADIANIHTVNDYTSFIDTNGPWIDFRDGRVPINIISETENTVDADYFYSYDIDLNGDGEKEMVTNRRVFTDELINFEVSTNGTTAATPTRYYNDYGAYVIDIDKPDKNLDIVIYISSYEDGNSFYVFDIFRYDTNKISIYATIPSYSFLGGTAVYNGKGLVLFEYKGGITMLYDYKSNTYHQIPVNTYSGKPIESDVDINNFPITATPAYYSSPIDPFESKESRLGEAAEVSVQLEKLGLFMGVGRNDDGSTNFELDRPLSRIEAVTMLVRALGKTTEPHKKTHPFSDVPDWADGYVSYAYENGLTNGVSDTLFGSNITATENMYLTFMLRALGYSDDDVHNDFEWYSPQNLARSKNIVPYPKNISDFSRGDASLVTCATLFALDKGGDKYLYENLISDRAFTKAQWDAAFPNGNTFRKPFE
jgi:hypothetical protein